MAEPGYGGQATPTPPPPPESTSRLVLHTAWLPGQGVVLICTTKESLPTGLAFLLPVGEMLLNLQGIRAEGRVRDLLQCLGSPEVCFAE
jgi:hypothetical protein